MCNYLNFAKAHKLLKTFIIAEITVAFIFSCHMLKNKAYGIIEKDGDTDKLQLSLGEIRK